MAPVDPVASTAITAGHPASLQGTSDSLVNSRSAATVPAAAPVCTSEIFRSEVRQTERDPSTGALGSEGTTEGVDVADGAEVADGELACDSLIWLPHALIAVIDTATTSSHSGDVLASFVSAPSWRVAAVAGGLLPYKTPQVHDGWRERAWCAPIPAHRPSSVTV